MSLAPENHPTLVIFPRLTLALPAAAHTTILVWVTPETIPIDLYLAIQINIVSNYILLLLIDNPVFPGKLFQTP